MSSIEANAEAAICSKCKAEVRPGSLFCYNCGGRVTAAEETSEILHKRPDAIAVNSQKGDMRPAPGLRSAAELRRRPGSAVRKPKRYVWEPVEESSDRHLLLVTILIFLFSLAMVGLALYLR